MLYCCFLIDYLPQLEKTAPDTVSDLFYKITDIVDAFGAEIRSKRNPMLICFPQNGIFNLIQASEAIEQIKESINKAETKLRNTALLVHYSDNPDSILSFFQELRQKSIEDHLYCISTEAKHILFKHEQAIDTVWESPSYRAMLGDADASKLFYRPILERTIAKTCSKINFGGPRLVHIEAGAGPRQLKPELFKALCDRPKVLFLDGEKTRKLPFSPLTELILEQARLQTAKSDIFSLEALSIAENSIFSCIVPDSVYKGCEDAINEWLDQYGSFSEYKTPSVLLCNNPGLFSTEAFDLIKQRLATNRGEENYISVSESELKDEWAGSWAAKISSDIADRDDRALALTAALGTTPGTMLSKLKTRYAELISTANNDTDSCMDLLSSLPSEASLYLYSIIEAEKYLSEAEKQDFLYTLGLTEKGKELISDLLVRAGLMQSDGMVLMPVSHELVRNVVKLDQADYINAKLNTYILDQYRNKKIRPGLAIFKMVSETSENDKLLFDCLFDSIVRPDIDLIDVPEFLSSSSKYIYEFWANMTLGNEAIALKLAEQAEKSIESSRSAAIIALMKAELFYAQGKADLSIKKAREAMISMGRTPIPVLEARLQRIMGLASLSLDRQAESTDYLSNSQEIADFSGAEHEKMMSTYTKAVAEFLTGAITKALKAAQIAENSAKKLHRVDALAMTGMLKGRMDIELGCYKEAALQFAAAAKITKEYDLIEASIRADIWKARALSYEGLFDEAGYLLNKNIKDTEAALFLAEMEILNNQPDLARKAIETITINAENQFSSPDSFNWNSILFEHEGKSTRQHASNPALQSFYTILDLYTRGLTEKDPAYAVKIHAISRSDTISRFNPSLALYSLFCYMLEETLGEAPIDKQTVLSRGFKLLQERAGRIDDRNKRTMYLEKNIWNARLMNAARKYKFI